MIDESPRSLLSQSDHFWPACSHRSSYLSCFVVANNRNRSFDRRQWRGLMLTYPKHDGAARGRSEVEPPGDAAAQR